ncbi:hypothetical protein JMJ58_04660 [Haloterrigena salifodinae]|uniref:Halobacterial output domain-containing protein n=1 Tax=Haloterrigena salifodinae TaxID=2675099 RepID=A0A8T8E373_9EURY|nr:HalOD1 output domain-containing protein [Haloterrigena salifodinae]QRV16189.1 hypothetical protein JMJ58_04660 [Haloterrigena salifodinae]
MSRPAWRRNLSPVDDDGGQTIYYDEDRGTYHTWCNDGTYELASTAVVITVASVLEVDTDDLERLSAAVEPDALNSLLGHWRRADVADVDGRITFPFATCVVTVHSTGEIVVDPEQRVPSVGR